MNADYALVMAIEDRRRQVAEWLYLREQWAPIDGDYVDAVHVRYYRLVQLQIARFGGEVGQSDAADQALAWLIATDADIQ